MSKRAKPQTQSPRPLPLDDGLIFLVIALKLSVGSCRWPFVD